LGVESKTEEVFQALREEELKERQRANNIGERFNELVDRYEERSEEYKKNIKDYNELLGNNRELMGRFESLQERYTELDDRFGDKNRECEELKRKYENEKQKHYEEGLNVALAQQENKSLSQQIDDKNQQLMKVTGEKSQLTIKGEEKGKSIEKLTIQIANLQVDNNKIRQELAKIQEEKNKKKQKDEWKIATLHEQLIRSQKDKISGELNNKKKNLEVLFHESGVNHQQSRKLQDAYD
ncbi:3248_t:CDS:2, partial [Paraglomus occultum]